MEIAVAIIHGIGMQAADNPKADLHPFAKPLVDGICRQLGAQASRVTFQSLYWADLLDQRERAYMQRVERAGAPQRWRWLRNIITTFLGDASGYRLVASGASNSYQQVHARVREGLTALRSRVAPNTPLVLITHSLGGHVMSNYIWDQHKLNQACPSNDPFLSLETLAGLITLGCNIPLFTFAYDTIQPIRFPGQQLSPALRQQAQWLNWYAPADPLGYPLKPLCAAYDKVVAEDIAQPVGPLLLRHTPASHIGYWRDRQVQQRISTYLLRLLNA
ncbi:hypothetical protein [Atopomonas sediminilitoris]|uniref:hypothetical protein n=1 Tax=Atopomonas sediminilitoris TaxID=2919919 RepID=UPI001F4DD53F|nr:hypothetical protein [Atopomonas sediminilitoris]MCJ8170860.1 hypothetical protein [Atopomonas sediminilitoris]